MEKIVQKLNAGDDAGLELLFEQFAERLMFLAQRHIAECYRHRVDAEDVVQSVFRSFLVRFRKHSLDFQSSEGLWGLLTVITVRKCADRIVHLRAGCRDVRREVSLVPTDCAEVSSEHFSLNREPSAEEACILSETVEQLLRSFDVEDRAAIELQLQGYSTTETAQQLGRPERTIRRIRARVRQQLIKQLNRVGITIDVNSSSKDDAN